MWQMVLLSKVTFKSTVPTFSSINSLVKILSPSKSILLIFCFKTLSIKALVMFSLPCLKRQWKTTSVLGFNKFVAIKIDLL